MRITFYAIWLALYLAPFVFIVATPGRRSFVVAASLWAAVLGLLWLALERVPIEDQNWGYALFKAAFQTVAVGALAGLVARGVTLAGGLRSFHSLGLVTTILALVASPIYLAAATGYDRWQRRLPTAECVAQPSFDVQLVAERISIPNWPLVMVSSSDEHFVLSIPTGVRRLCERAGDGLPMTADSATFFFSHVTFQPLKGGVKAWADRECRDAAEEVAASLVCGERPLEQLSVYADADFPKRSIAFGRIASRIFYATAGGRSLYAD